MSSNKEQDSPRAAAAAPRRRRFGPRRLGAWLLGIALVPVLIGAHLDVLIALWCTPKPPRLAARPAIAAMSVSRRGGLRRIGRCWRREHRGQHVMYLEGDPYTVGHCNSALADEVLDRQQRALEAALRRFVPSRLAQRALARGLMAVYRDLPQAISEARKLEILGIARGRRDRYPELGPKFGRLVFYHAIHDISQSLVDSPLLACSAFAASGAATRDGHTLLARVFDFEGGRVFDEDKFVVFYRPRYGIPFVSVAWGGMAGAVSGMNAAGLGIVLDAAGSDSMTTSGTPTTLLVRRVLQYARSLDEAIALLSAGHPLISDILTIADGNSGALAVVELTPGGLAVRRRRQLITATNHLQHARFSHDRENRRRIAHGTTLARHRRLVELVHAARGSIDPRVAQRILRDRRAAKGAPLPLGHRGAIDALIATHAVVFDLSARKLWVSKPPHTLGEFVAYDLREVLDGTLRDRGALPADPLRGSAAYRRLAHARRLLRRAELSGDDARAIALLRRARRDAPRLPELLIALARRCGEADRTACSREAYQAFLASDPPHRKNADEARAALAQQKPLR